jgi:mono/diheme cytochrome c family protein
MLTRLPAALLFCLAIPAAAVPSADDGAALFADHCAACFGPPGNALLAFGVEK